MTALIEREADVLVADLFCGAGGSSTGAEKAARELGIDMQLVCVNHWPLAIETHQRNHPSARHYVQDLTVADPEKLVPEGRLDLLMASPECTYHSNARGGKPIHDQKRMDPWAVIRWLTHLDVRCVLIENVPEFVNWGPLDEQGRPDKKKRGVYFEAWRNAIIGLGYEVQHRSLNAADFGDATTRTRFFLQARKDGRSIVWPEPTHARGGPDALFSNRERWRSAREIIDWSNPGRSLLDHPKYLRQPLSEKTRLRIARGLERFGGPLAPLYIALLGLPGESSSGRTPAFGAGDEGSNPSSPASFVMGKQSAPSYRDVDEPLPTLTTMAAPLLIEPSADLVGANRNNNVPKDVEEPVPGLTTAPGGGLYLVEVAAEPFTLGQQSGGAPRSVDEPAPTITTGGAVGLVQPFLVPYYRTGVAHGVDEPVQTVTTKDRQGLAWALVVPYGPRAEARSVDEPVPTILTKDRLGVADFVLSRHGNDLQRDVDLPIPTATGRGAGYLVEPEAFIVPKFGEREGQKARIHDVADPLPTVTGDGAGRLVSPLLVQTDQTGSNGNQVRPVSEPLYTIVTSPNQAFAHPCILQVNHAAQIQLDDSKVVDGRVRSVDDPTWSLTTHRNVALAQPVLEAIASGVLDPKRLVIIDDQLYQLDIRFRMLVNRELARAMSFDDEETEYEFVGTAGEVTKQIGNAVPVRLAGALVKAVLA